MAVKAQRKSEVGSQKSEVPGGPKQSPLELDRLIHERLRLGIVSALAANDQLTFNELKRLLETTDHSIEQVAAEAGFGSAAVLRVHFGDVVGTSPLTYRRAFSRVDHSA